MIFPQHANSGDKVYGEARPDKALIYFVQGKGTTQQLFADKQWLGVLRNNSYAFFRIDPGEHLLWAGNRAYELVFLESGQTYYFELRKDEIISLPITEGPSLVDAAGTYAAVSADDPAQAKDFLSTYRSVRTRAVAGGVYKPCRFTDARVTEYEKKASNADSNAAFELGELYRLGKCVDQDGTAAVHWYTASAAAGDARSARIVAGIYREGSLVPRDMQAAEKWYRQAADQGDLSAQRRLGDMYQYGVGVEQDMEAALKWYGRAVDEHEDDWAANRLRRINNNEPDPKRQKQQREQAEQRVLAENKETARLNRLKAIEEKYGRLFVAVSPFEDQAKIELPRRKKLDEKETGGSLGGQSGSNIEYMLPPEILLGAIAVAMVYDAIDSSLKKRLSDEEKLEIETAAGVLTKAFEEQALQQEMRRRIVKSAYLPKGVSLFVPVEYKFDDQGAVRYSDIAAPGADLVLEVETRGIGLVLTEKRYRPTRFLMANVARLIKASDGTVLRQKDLCYVSKQAPRFSAWARNDANLVKAEIESAFSEIAEELLVMLTSPPVDSDLELSPCDQLKEKEASIELDADESRSR